MKLYTYSSELHSFVEAKWATAKFTTGGILVGVAILFGVFTLNQSVGNEVVSRSANALAVENDILRQQLSLISPRVSKLEMQARQSLERANELHVLLLRRKIVVDADSSFTNATKGSRLQSAIRAAKSFRP